MFHDHPSVRSAIYILAIVAQIAAFFINVYDASLGEAFQYTANFLGGIAGITALSNLTTRPPADRTP